jgi:hypothetical protein
MIWGVAGLRPNFFGWTGPGVLTGSGSSVPVAPRVWSGHQRQEVRVWGQGGVRGGCGASLEEGRHLLEHPRPQTVQDLQAFLGTMNFYRHLHWNGQAAGARLPQVAMPCTARCTPALGPPCVGVFLDLKKAFDVFSHLILLKKMQKMGINGVALDWFTIHLSGRSQREDIDSTQHPAQHINHVWREEDK